MNAIKPMSCKRSWEGEAARDGRLNSQEQMSFERHVAACAVCAAEDERLASLAALLAELPVSPVNELSLRRRRHELLARARTGAVHAPTSQRRLWPVAALTLVACVIGFIGYRWQSPAPREQAVALRPAAGARYAHKLDEQSEIVHLSEGRLTLESQKLAQRKLLVRTPDGEIEDVGTIFTVSVKTGRTEFVSVAEGRVVARIAHKPERWIAAGETHYPYGEPQVARAEPAPQPSPSTQLESDAGTRAPRAALPTKHRAAPQERAQEDAGDDQAASQFAAAVARVEAHDNARALDLLQQFMRRFPNDLRAEDAAFLHLVVLSRLGENGALRGAAQAYLRQYPHGLRRPEVQRLLETNQH